MHTSKYNFLATEENIEFRFGEHGSGCSEVHLVSSLERFSSSLRSQQFLLIIAKVTDD